MDLPEEDSRSRSPKGFRRRWTAGEASSLQDAAPMQDDEVSGPLQMQSVPSDAKQFDSSNVDVRSLSQHVSSVASASAYQVTRSSDIRLPWQQGPLAPLFNRRSGIFRPLNMWNMPRVGLTDMYGHQSAVQTIPRVPALPSPATNLARQRIAASKFYVPEDELRTKALNQFKLLLLMDLKATELGVSMMDAVGSLDTATDVLSVLRDALSNKATGTLIKRAGSMWRFAQWIVSRHQGSCFGQPEQVIYKYMQHLKDTGAAPTSASHFLEALAFCDTVFRFVNNGSSKVLTARVKGASHSMFLVKRILKQAPAFTVECVKRLEDICLHDARAHCRVIAGSILFCIFACSRWADAMHVESLKLDKFVTFVILEAATSKHKTSMSKESKTRLLPFTCIGKFLSDESWGESYMRSRTLAGLTDEGLFQPSWNDMAQTWASHAMTSGECNCWLGEFLQDYEVSTTSHSCKTTILTWAGMTNIFSREERTLLGHHVEPQQKSATTYNRDSQILLMYKVQRLINLIKAGHLKPDASRAERLCMMFGGGDVEQHEYLVKGLELGDEEPLQLESDSDSDNAEISDEDNGCLGLASEHERGELPSDSMRYSWYVHRLSSILHCKEIGVVEKLSCGRVITANLKEIEHSEINSQIHLMCHQCNANMRQVLPDQPDSASEPEQ